MKKERLYRLQTQCHYVYFGWLFFLDRFYDLKIYDNHTLKSPYGEHFTIKVLKSYGLMGMFYNLVKPPIKGNDYHTLKIVGDVFSNSMCLYYLFARNTIFYSEFHLGEGTSWKKKVLFRMFGFFFRNRKFVFMTSKAYETFAPITTQRLRMPYLYLGDIHSNPTLESPILKILFVGKLGDKRKNVRFMMDALATLKDENIEIGLAGNLNSINPDFPPSSEYFDFTKDYENYKAIFGDKLNYHGFVNHETIHELYTQYNLFILPSKFESVGAVVMEAMAHSIPVLVSHTVGAADYVEDGTNGFIFELDNTEEFLAKINFFLDHPSSKETMGLQAYKTIKENHRYKNEELLKRLHTDFKEFNER